MTDPSQHLPLADIAAATGYVGYDWDFKANRLIWFGPWQSLFGESAHPPFDTEQFASAVLPDDQHLVFNDGLPAFDREYRLRRSDGRVIWVSERGITHHSEGRAVRQQGILRLVDAPQRRCQTDTASGEMKDPLTGRLNRAAMLARLGHVLEGPADLRQNSAYLVIGIDNMIVVNEAVGSKSADKLLCNVADRLTELSPTKAVIARVGGDIFGILLPGIGNGAAALASHVLQSFRDRPVSTSAEQIHITVSIGGARLADSAIDAQEIMIRAENALHEARDRGRNQFVEYQASPERCKVHRAVLEMGERVKDALKLNRLRLAYQPIVEAATGRVLFYEALARMFHEDGRLIPAADFVPVVENLGLAFEFDRHVLRMAIHEMEAASDLWLAVNVSGLTAAQADWPEHVQRILKPRPNVANRLIVEITETAAIMDVAETRNFAKILNQLGAQVSLDDFGAGSTSIRHLRTLPLAIMKIDKELLANLVGNKEQQHLVRTLICLARGLGIKTVAEGVETAEVAAWLKQEKVDMMQGYYFGKPSLDRPWLERDGSAMPKSHTSIIVGPLMPQSAELSTTPAG